VAVSPELVASPRHGRAEAVNGRPTLRRQDLLASAAGVAAMACLSAVRGVWVVQALALVLLLTVPGLLLVRAARVSPQAVRAFPVYVLGGSLAVLMISGLAVDLLGSPLGISRPLATVPLVTALTIACAALIAAAVPGSAARVRDYVRVDIRVWQAWPLLLPVLAWVGAMRLTNGDGALLAIAAATAAGAALLFGCVRARRSSIAMSATVIYGASLALMWGFSLRGHFVDGFDIATEYHTFTSVLAAGSWHTAHHNDSYGAMLSLTILPSMLTTLTGASPLLVLKAIYPCLFALFPVAVFLLASRVLRPGFAYLATLFLVVQSYLFEQLPEIARQEIGLLFFIFLLNAIIDQQLLRRQRTVLIAVFAVGLVLSHYSTAYLAIIVLFGALVLELLRGRVLSKFIAAFRDPQLPLGGIATAFAVTLVAAGVWYGPVTHSAQNVSHFADELSNKGLDLLPGASGKGIVDAYLAGNVLTPISASQFQTLAQADYAKHRPYVHPLTLPRVLHSATVKNPPIVSHPVFSALHSEQEILSLFANVVAAIGALLLWLRRGADRRARIIALFGVSTLIALVVVRFSGTAAEAYNQERAFLQAMVPLSVSLAWVLQWRAARGVGRVLAAAFAAALMVFFLTTSGLRGAFLGGERSFNLASSGENVDRFYITEPELAAADWLNAAAPKRDLIYADRYGALRILGATGRFNNVLTQITPATVDRHAWIYADTANFVRQLARGQEGNQYALYEWPSFVSEHWNLLYSNSSAGVYGRTP
jgi:uncharacterized membrane protein